MTPIQFIDFFMDFGYEFRHKRHQSDLEFFVLDTHVGASCRLDKVPSYDIRFVVEKNLLTLWITKDGSTEALL